MAVCVQIMMVMVLLLGMGLLTSASRSGRYTALGTFNTALVPQYPQMEERTAILIELIQESELDVICLQEVWMVNVQREIRNGLKDDYPYSVSIADLSVETTTDSERACKSSDVNLYGACLLTNCTDPSDPTCIIRECVHILSGLSAECKFCLVVQVGTADGITACAAEPAADYGRSFGLLLLSKKEILSSHAEGYLGNVSEVRGYYQASIKDVGQVFCTHLSVGLADIEDYVGPPVVSPFLFTTYAEQQFQELVILLYKAAHSDSSILLGDFNHGPTIATSASVSNITSEFPFNYGYVNAMGYYSPFVLKDGRCTLCNENGVVSIQSRTVDHIYVPVTSSNRVIHVQRLWDDQFTSAGIPLSDHYGVKVLLQDLTSCTYDWDFCLFQEGKKSFSPIKSADADLERICTAL